MNSQSIDAKVLALDLANLSAEDREWLHDLRNKAMVMQGRILQKKIKESGETL